jgi:hypothetical protein
MARAHIHDRARVPPFVPGAPRPRYLVVCQDNAWHIKFDGEEYGPYVSEREALLFAIEAAHLLGNQGEPTEVLVVDENGRARPQWSSGLDPYPPRH